MSSSSRDLLENVVQTIVQGSVCINGKLCAKGGMTQRLPNGYADPPMFLPNGRDKLVGVAATVAKPIVHSALFGPHKDTYKYLATLASILACQTYEAFAAETACDTVFMLLKVLNFATPQAGNDERTFQAQLLNVVSDIRTATTESRPETRKRFVNFLMVHCSRELPR